MCRAIGFERDNWQDPITRDDKMAIRFPCAGASISIGELPRGSFLPCPITESSEVFVSPDHGYDLELGRACRADAMKAYARFLQTLGDHQESASDCFMLEHVYNHAIVACCCGIPQAQMAQDLSNLRAYWLPRLCKKAQVECSNAAK